MRTATLNREQQPTTRFIEGMAVEKRRLPSLEELGREVEVLRGKLQSLRTANERIDREAQKLSELLQAVLNANKSKADAA